MARYRLKPGSGDFAVRNDEKNPPTVTVHTAGAILELTPEQVARHPGKFELVVPPPPPPVRAWDPAKESLEDHADAKD